MTRTIFSIGLVVAAAVMASIGILVAYMALRMMIASVAAGGNYLAPDFICTRSALVETEMKCVQYTKFDYVRWSSGKIDGFSNMIKDQGWCLHLARAAQHHEPFNDWMRQDYKTCFPTP